jgi:hypothetical protein
MIQLGLKRRHLLLHICIKKVPDRPCTHKVTLRSFRVNFVTVKTVLLYILCVYVALFSQHAKRMRHVILFSVSYWAVPCIYTLSHKMHDFRKKLLNMKCVLIFSTTCLKHLLL